MSRAPARLLLLLLPLLAACEPRVPAPDGAIVVATTNSPLDLDPRVAGDEASQKVHQLLYGTLLRIDDDLRMVPELAETFEQLDPLTYVATLRRGVRFHNGRELTAADVVYTFRPSRSISSRSSRRRAGSRCSPALAPTTPTWG